MQPRVISHFPRGGFPVDPARGCCCCGAVAVAVHAAVLGRVERDEAVAAVVEAEGDELLGEVAGAHVVAEGVVGARGAVADLQDSLAQPAN